MRMQIVFLVLFCVFMGLYFIGKYFVGNPTEATDNLIFAVLMATLMEKNNA